MRDVLEAVDAALRGGSPIAVATVVKTWSSAPRQPGAAMAVTLSGEAIGSVSGGCVEGAVYEVATEVLETGVPQVVTYGVSDDDALAVGLTCGGIIRLLVERIDADGFPELPAVAAAQRDEVPVAVVTVVESPEPDPDQHESVIAAGPPVGSRMVVWADRIDGSLGSTRLDDAVSERARGMLEQGQTGIQRLGADGERRGDDLAVFIVSYQPPPRMYVFGAIDFAAAVVRMGKFLGYRVTVCDARPIFATKARFPEADELVVDWPHRFLDTAAVDERTVMCVLTHDPKFDVPLLLKALRTPAAYVGAMGSRRTHDNRLALLRAEGLTEAELRRLRSPIGLDLGARTPEETAVSVAAEIIALRWGGTGAALADLDTPIHRDAPAPTSARMPSNA
ncbi:MAG: pucA2 [Pseudonocardiales bacterium]|nr:pucA2 [Pseudonocardiales bacterium]